MDREGLTFSCHCLHSITRIIRRYWRATRMNADSSAKWRRSAFNVEAATQVAARFLALSGGSMRYIRLVKFMYFADREALRRWGYPLTWDSYYLMENGPILSCALDLMRGCHADCDREYWDEHIRRQFWSSVLVSNPGADRLPGRAANLIDELWIEYRKKDIVAVSHDPRVTQCRR